MLNSEELKFKINELKKNLIIISQLIIIPYKKFVNQILLLI
jgi:hypothetical protein